ncbi:hypothetical protein WAK64_16775 [Bacillus spongiae]|uniref:Spore coat protein n=1 Tax=Bacillus spongiae TaxID=2683610 RepID=A0ABU8HHV6_9BACI
MGHYQLCNRYRGQVVRIRERNGRMHYGRINRVSRSHVYLSPVRPRGRGYAYDGIGYDYGYGYYGYPYGGFGLGFGVGIAFGVIATVALASLFFW